MCKEPFKKEGCTCNWPTCTSCTDPDHAKVCFTCRTPRGQLKETPWAHFPDNGDHAIQCKECYKIELQKKKDAFAESGKDTTYQSDMICPYCGELQSSDDAPKSFYEDGEHIETCQLCNEKFTVQTSVAYTYSTYKKDGPDERNN